jgi:two-component system chemotaxis response regulator CheB
MGAFAVIVIGASKGGVAALQTLVADMDPQIPAAICIALHIDAHKSMMPSLLQRRGPFPARHAATGDAIVPGSIYIAPPDNHLLIHAGHAIAAHGPRVNMTRPAIDPLFRSAASAYGSRVLGVLLTGMLNDGTVGLIEIKRHGGLAVVQDPRDAAAPEMPASALTHVDVDYCVPLSKMPQLLGGLAKSIAQRPREEPARAGGIGHGVA